MCILLKSSQNTQLRKRLRMKKIIANVICKSIDRERRFLFLENIYYNGKDFVCFNVVSHEQILAFDFRDERKMIKLLFENNRLGIKCHKIYFELVDFKCVELSMQFACIKWTKSSAANDAAIEMAISNGQKHAHSSSPSTSNSNLTDLVLVETAESGVSMGDVDVTRAKITPNCGSRSGENVQTGCDLVNKADLPL